MIIILVGRSASGKSTIAKEFEKLGFERIITYTTREKRPYEIDDVDYHFIDNQKFLDMAEVGFFAEITHYEMKNGVVFYGSKWIDYIDDVIRVDSGDYKYKVSKNKVIILNPHGIKYLKEKSDIPLYSDMKVVWINPSEQELLKRLLDRKDDQENIKLRFEGDRKDFQLMRDENLFDVEITDILTPEEMAKRILKELNYEH